ncbi:MAG: 1,4-dihydroxy-2-naphthoate octaprenyltransferase [Candidatus Kapaibacterium sp.]|nr:MAG: 1,4-dihydroxy-2-naphthoate octaprenyltransferase [Candidatus Kapabacteria bacterium]
MKQWRWWVQASRPKTLVLSFFPTACGIAWAWHDGVVIPVRAGITLVCAVLLQVLANYVNELGDYVRGADTPDRLGPPRAVAMGAISPSAMRRASLIVSAVVLALGLVLVAQVGWWLLAVGLAALLLAWLYTMGARPLAYLGLGELAAVVFFGLVPSAGAYAIERLALAAEPIISGLAFGAFAAAVLGINNVRDLQLDRQVGKHTLAVRLGKDAATRLLHLLLAIPYATALVLSIWYPAASSALVTLPFAWTIARDLQHADGKAYNQLLARTLLLTTLYGVLLIGAIVLRPLTTTK